MTTDTEHDPQRHNRVLLHAAQTAHPVMHKGLKCFVQCLVFNIHDGMTVYLTGDPTPVPADQVTLAKRIEDESAPAGPDELARRLRAITAAITGSGNSTFAEVMGCIDGLTEFYTDAVCACIPLGAPDGPLDFDTVRALLASADGKSCATTTEGD